MKLLALTCLVLLLASSQAVFRSKSSSHSLRRTNASPELLALHNQIAYLNGRLQHEQSVLRRLQTIRGKNPSIDKLTDQIFSKFQRKKDQTISWFEFQSTSAQLSKETGIQYPEFTFLRGLFDGLSNHTDRLNRVQLRAGIVVQLDTAINDRLKAIKDHKQAVNLLVSQIKALEGVEKAAAAHNVPVATVASVVPAVPVTVASPAVLPVVTTAGSPAVLPVVPVAVTATTTAHPVSEPVKK